MAVIRPDLPGQVDPLGFFDPWGLSVGTTEKIFKRWQESEVLVSCSFNLYYLNLDIYFVLVD